MLFVVNTLILFLTIVVGILFFFTSYSPIGFSHGGQISLTTSSTSGPIRPKGTYSNSDATFYNKTRLYPKDALVYGSTITLLWLLAYFAFTKKSLSLFLIAFTLIILAFTIWYLTVHKFGFSPNDCNLPSPYLGPCEDPEHQLSQYKLFYPFATLFLILYICSHKIIVGSKSNNT